MLSPLGTPDVIRYGIAETELAFLGQLHDHRGRHRLGVRRDPEVVSAPGGLKRRAAWCRS
jgi:hypothetical protein